MGHLERLCDSDAEFAPAAADTLTRLVGGPAITRDAQLAEITEAVPLGIVFVDNGGQITYANSQAEHVLRLDRSAIAGRTYDDPSWKITSLDGGEFPADQLPFARVTATLETVRDVQHAIEHADGTRAELSINGVPLLDGHGHLTGMVATIDDITERRLADLTRRRFAAIVESSTDAIIAKAADGTITDWNLGAEEVYGHLREHAVGRHVSFIVPDHRLEELEHVHARVRAGETIRSLETERIRADGQGVWVSLTVAPIVDDGGSVVGMSAIARDVTEQVALREERARYALELERSNRDLEQFAYVASHDLQEPLRMVTSFLQLLARRYEGQLDETADQYIGFAVDGAQRMRRLIDDLLSYSRVGTRGSPFEPVDLGALTKDTLQDLAEAINDAGATIEVGALPVVDGDPAQLGQVLQNLIGNALKFRGNEPPRVRVHAEVDGDAYVVTVEDHGIGIPPEHNERIFIIFQRLHGRDEYPGTGMGLAISKKIVERHGGRLWVEAPDHPGTAMRFTLPIPEGDPVV